MKKVLTIALIFSLSLATGVALTWIVAPSLFFSPLDNGPLDYEPRLEASAIGPGGHLTVKVFRHRPPDSRFLGALLVVKVYGGSERVVYERVIGDDGAWSELDAKYRISFEGDLIRVSRTWCRACGPAPLDDVIRMADLGAK